MKKVVVNGVTLSVTEISQRPRRRSVAIRDEAVPIILIHGLAASSAFWHAAGVQFIALLGPCILYDLRGHGKSHTPDSGYRVEDLTNDLFELLNAEGVEKAHIVSHSFGGMIALNLALSHPERVRSLVLADVRVRPLRSEMTVARRTIPPAVERRLCEIGIDLKDGSHFDDGVGYLRTVARIEIEGGDDAEALIRALYGHPRLFRSRRSAVRWLSLTEGGTFLDDLQSSNPFEPEDLKKLTLPMLMLAAKESAVLPSARALARLCPHGVIKEIPNVGHFFPMSHPKLFLRPTLRFLRAVNRNHPAPSRELIYADDLYQPKA